MKALQIVGWIWFVILLPIAIHEFADAADLSRFITDTPDLLYHVWKVAQAIWWLLLSFCGLVTAMLALIAEKCVVKQIEQKKSETKPTKTTVKVQANKAEKVASEIYCPYCGKRTETKTQVCDKCGKSLSKVFEDSDYECGSCKKNVPEGALYCWYCGEKFET